MKNLREIIIERDKNLYREDEILEIHHIDKDRKNNNYQNLIAIPYSFHRFKVHIKGHKLYMKQFYQYTAQFSEPENWAKIILFSIEQDKKRFKKKISNKVKLRNRLIAKEQREKEKQKYKDEHDGLSYFQVQYRNQKKYKNINN